MKVRAKRNPVDFAGQTLAGEILMDSLGFIPEHVDRLRIAKHFPAGTASLPEQVGKQIEHVVLGEGA